MKKIDYLIFLQTEIEELKTRIRPEDTGHIYTTINTLEERVEEVKEDLRKMERSWIYH